jgi:hypothetical protein
MLAEKNQIEAHRIGFVPLTPRDRWTQLADKLPRFAGNSGAAT